MSGLAEPIVTMSEAQAYVRIETGEEEALLAGGGCCRHDGLLVDHRLTRGTPPCG